MISTRPNFRWAAVLLTAHCFFTAVKLTSAEPPVENGLSPAEALASFRLNPDIQIELVASEPLVQDPVAIAFDHRGAMYVAENRGYPIGGAPGGIALLHDRDHDGTFETRTEFAGGLSFPNGLLPWKGGVFVTCAPDVLFLKDTDGDGQADHREVVLTGFATRSTTQLRVSHPTLGVDNWIYLTSGLVGGNVTAPAHPEFGSVQANSDFRFDPISGRFEQVTGKGQFGLAFDDFGNRFICVNRVHVQHVVLPAPYLQRNPHLNFGESIQNVPENMADEPLKGHGRAARIFPISQNITTADSHAGTFTAACGLLVYRGNALPSAYHGNVFACDPTGNLVHRDHLESAGATFSAHRVDPEREVLASTDNWFRPVNLAHGPDGALYICDMYRKTIEHPQYLPEEIRKRTDFESGRGMGRIYRLVATGEAAARVPDRKNLTDSQALPELLLNSNGWVRDLAHRLLLERQPKDTIPLLLEILEKPKDDSAPARARLHAFYLLEAMGQLTPARILQVLQDPSPALREHALKLSEAFIRNDPALESSILKMAQDPNARVRFQCALTLGEKPTLRSAEALAAIARRDAQDRWCRAAVLSAANGIELPLLNSFLEQISEPNEAQAEFCSAIAAIIGARAERDAILKILQDRWARDTVLWHALLSGLADAWQKRNPQGALPWSESTDHQLKGFISQLFDQAITAASAQNAPLWERVFAVQWLSYSPSDTAPVLLPLLEPDVAVELQVAAVTALTRTADPAVSAALLEPSRWNRYTPGVRNRLVSHMLSRVECTEALLNAISKGAIPPWVIPSNQQKALLEHSNETVRAQAGSLFGTKPAQQRSEVYGQKLAALKLQGDPSNGKELFRARCASCHRLDREGASVGPDLFGMRNQSKETILLHVVAPNLEVTPGFEAFDIKMKDGRTIAGILRAENENSITIRTPLGEDETVSRSHVETVSGSALSLMPEGLEEGMSLQEISDLLAYLKGE